MDQMLQNQEDQRTVIHEQRDFIQFLMLNQGQMQKQLTGSVALQLQQYQAQLQHGTTSTTCTLPLKRSADAMQAEGQFSSKNAMRRQKRQVTLEKQKHERDTAAQQQHLQEMSDKQSLDPTPAAAASQDTAGDATASASDESRACPCSVCSSATSVQPAASSKDIPGDGRGLAWQQWQGSNTTLASMPFHLQ